MDPCRWIDRPRTLALALLMGAAWAASTRADGPRGAEWIAPEALAFLEVVRPAEVLGRLTGEPVPSVLASNPNYRKYLESPAYRGPKAALDAAFAKLGTTWDQGLLKMAGGGLVVAIEPAGPPRGILIATPLDPAFLAKALETFVGLARDDAEANGRPDPIRSAEHRGVVGYAVGPKAALAIVDGTLVIAESGETLKRVIDRSMDKPEVARTLAGDPLWQARRAAHRVGDTSAWALVRMDRVRQIHPDVLRGSDMGNPLITILLANWLDAVRKSPWISAGLTTHGDVLAVEATVPVPPGGYSAALGRFAPTRGRGAPGPVSPPGMIASVGLWRDLSGLWEVRSDLFPPPVLQGFAQLDTFAGTFFGGRDFGTGVLGALGTDWRLVVARQDYTGFDPVPGDKLPAFALIADLKPDDEDFAIRLKAAFQSFIGLINLGAAQTKAPPLMLGTETVDGVSISTARFLKPRVGPAPGEPVNSRHNFSPAVAQVGRQFILGSSVGLVRDLIPALKQPAGPTDATLLIRADGATLAALLRENRARLVMQNMLEKGNDKPAAEVEVDFLARALQALGQGSLTARDTPDDVRFRLEFTLDPAPAPVPAAR